MTFWQYEVEELANKALQTKDSKRRTGLAALTFWIR